MPLEPLLVAGSLTEARTTGKSGLAFFGEAAPVVQKRQPGGPIFNLYKEL
jgi:hypothetical protein